MPVKKKTTEVVVIPPIKERIVEVWIKGTAPLIMHRWSEKARRMMLETKQGRRTKKREACDPETEAKEAMYTTKEGLPAIPAMAIKKSLIGAAHKSLGCEKTLVRKAVKVHADESRLIPLIPALCSDPIVREDPVRVSNSSTDLRYRPQFTNWAARISCTIDEDLLKVEDLLNLFNRAGFGVGICEMRPERGGDFGTFKVMTMDEVEDAKKKITKGKKA